MNKLTSFIIHNYKAIIKVCVGVFALYWIVFVLTPKTSMSAEQKQILDSILVQVKILHENNSKLEEQINDYNQEIQQIDININKIKGQKTIVKEIYHEKINSVDRLTIRELDSFFTERYNK